MRKVKMIHPSFGFAMLVAEDRVEEYKAAGHKLAASTFTPKEKPEEMVLVKELKEEEPEEKGLVKELKEEKKNNKRK